jgi:hypothetical protein
MQSFQPVPFRLLHLFPTNRRKRRAATAYLRGDAPSRRVKVNVATSYAACYPQWQQGFDANARHIGCDDCSSPHRRGPVCGDPDAGPQALVAIARAMHLPAAAPSRVAHPHST